MGKGVRARAAQAQRPHPGLASRQDLLNLARAVQVPVRLKFSADVVGLFDPEPAVDSPVQHVLQRRAVQPLHPDDVSRRHGAHTGAGRAPNRSR
eukprot:scaffold24658_cov113-Isochrysis_galbana.AAC.5